MKKCINNYFKQVNTYKIIVLNIILSLVASYPVMISSLFIFGLFVKPTILERIIGIIVLVTTVLLFVFFNYLLYKIDKKKANNKKLKLRIMITFLIIILLSGLFFIFPDIWLKIWGFIF